MSRKYEVDRYSHFGTTLQSAASRGITERIAAGWQIEHTIGGESAFIVIYSREEETRF